jgi:galactokinase
MSEVRWIDECRRAGFDATAAESRARQVSLAVDRLGQATPREPLGAWVVPGRIEVVGKHTDYAGGRSLVAAVPRGFAVVAAPRDDDRVRVIDARYPGEIAWSPDEAERVFPGWTNYVATVARRLTTNFPGASLGADIVIASDLPRAAGVSSSSALVVGLAHALIDRGRLRERPEWRAAVSDPRDVAGYLGALENGLSFRSLEGTRGVGAEGGSQDHTAILLSRAETVCCYGYAPVRHLADAAMPADWRFVIMTSGVHAGKASDVRDRFNRASRAVTALVDLWNQARHESQTTLASILASHPDASKELELLAASDGHAGFSAGDLVQRLAHFVSEDARALQTLAAFREGDTTRVGELSLASQTAADVELGNQVTETRALARVAREGGAFAASSFGAGFGGSVWALVEGGDRESHEFAQRWFDAYRQACPSVSGVAWFSCRPAPGLTALSVA